MLSRLFPFRMTLTHNFPKGWLLLVIGLFHFDFSNGQGSGPPGDGTPTMTLGDAGLAAKHYRSWEIVGRSGSPLFPAEPPKNGGQSSQGSSRGEPQNNPLVVEGFPVYPREFTYNAVVLLKADDGLFFMCGGVLLDATHVLTAAHCLDYLEGNPNGGNYSFEYFVAVGIHNFSAGLSNPGSQLVDVEKGLVHPRYDETTDGWPHDIGILFLKEAIVTNDFVTFATLAERNDSFVHDECIFSGFGETTDGSIPQILQFGLQQIPTNQECRRFWAVVRDSPIHGGQICGWDYPTSICYGDSGSALTCGGKVAGIASWLLSNCSGCFPSVFTRIGHYFKWIMKVISVTA